MKSIHSISLFVGIAAAHSAVQKIVFDGNEYQARDVRMDNTLGANRIEWKFSNAFDFPWHAITDTQIPGFAYKLSLERGLNPSPPEIKAVARAGANVSVEWTNIIRMHNGPVVSYLGALKSPDQKATDIDFFKISEAGYDKTRRKWANEDLIEHDTTDHFQLPSDIKPGTYVLRTELLALHGNMMSSKPSESSGPQFYIHCFNVDITGNGNVEPKGVKFPGGYQQTDPGVAFNLYKGGQAAKDNYVIPGPPKYAGKYEAPSGSPPKVTPEQRGAFANPEFEAKYQSYRIKLNTWADKMADLVNLGQPGTRTKSGLDGAGLQEYSKTRPTEKTALDKEMASLKEGAIKLGYIKG